MSIPESCRDVSAGADPSLTDQDGPTVHDRALTIPNIICALRIIGSLLLPWLAWQGLAMEFTVGFVILSLSDWVDGKLARWLNQRSVLGARLDSLSDSILYLALFVGAVQLRWHVLSHELPWILAAFGSYALTSGYGLWKYGKVPSYHTRAAKITQWLVLFGAVALLLEWAVWPLRIAAAAGTLTNLEATAMTWYLDHWQADVPSLRAARLTASRRRQC